MTKNDLEFFTEVRNKSVEFLHDKTKYTFEQVKKWFNETPNVYYIVSIGIKKIGYFRTSNYIDDTCYIGMDIHPDFRGQGWATISYVKFMEKLHLEKGINTLYLEVLPHNERAIYIYNKLGFKVIEKDNTNILMKLNYDNKK